MSIQVFPQPSTGYLQFSGYIAQNKYGTPADATNKVEFEVTKPLDAGTYLIINKQAASGYDGFNVAGVTVDVSDGDNIVTWATGASTYKYLSRARWNENISYTNLTTRIGGIAYGNGFYVMAGAAANQGCISTDGANWTTRTDIGNSVPVSISPHRNVSFVNNYFIINHQATTNIMISTNATTWTSRLVATSVIPSGQWAYSTNEGLYYNFYANGGIVVSSDLVTFTTRAIFAGSGAGSESSVYYASPWWVKVDNNGFIVSTNGTNWTTRNPLPGFNPSSSAFGNNRFAVTFNNTTTVAVSTDTINWTTGAMPWSSATAITYMIYANGYFSAVLPGLNNSTYTGLFSSTDGLNWVGRDFGSNNNQNLIFWGTTGGYILVRGNNVGVPDFRRSLTIAGGLSGTARWFGYAARNDITNL